MGPGATRHRVWPAASLAVAALACALCSCESGGHFTVLGYTSRPNYDPCIKTVYVPIFKNTTFWRGLEFDLTRAVVREIEQKTPFKVVSDPEGADTELTGTILVFQKNILNRNQLNEQRETETTLTVAVIWRDLRSGEILSQPKPSPAGPVFAPLPELPNSVAGVPAAGRPVDPANVKPMPVTVTSVAGFIPEVGQSITTAQQQNFNRMATQIVAMMEKPW